jgi:hypothetical protein
VALVQVMLLKIKVKFCSEKIEELFSVCTHSVKTFLLYDECAEVDFFEDGI